MILVTANPPEQRLMGKKSSQVRRKGRVNQETTGRRRSRSRGETRRKVERGESL